MKKWTVAVVVAGALAFGGTAWADENGADSHGNHGTTPTQESGHSKAESTGSTETLDQDTAESHDMTPEEHETMTSTEHTHDTEPAVQEESVATDSHEEEAAGGHGHGGGEVVETPPNIPVLSAFAAVMAGFILYGAWNKWWRRKGGAAV